MAIWPTLWPHDLVIWPLTYKIYRPMCSTRLYIRTKFSQDWLKLRTVSRKIWQFNLNMNIESQLWRHAVTSSVISSTPKVIFWGIMFDDLSIYDVKMNLYEIYRNFQNGRHFEVRAIFYTASCTESWVLHQDRPCYSLYIPYILSSWSTF